MRRRDRGSAQMRRHLVGRARGTKGRQVREEQLRDGNLISRCSQAATGSSPPRLANNASNARNWNAMLIAVLTVQTSQA